MIIRNIPAQVLPPFTSKLLTTACSAKDFLRGWWRQIPSLISWTRASQASTTHSCFTHIHIETIWPIGHASLLPLLWIFFLSQHYNRSSGSSWLADHSIFPHPDSKQHRCCLGGRQWERAYAKSHQVTAPQDAKEAGLRGKDGRTDGRKKHSRVLS